MSKKYRLLKPTPDSNVGDVYIWNESQKAYYKDGNVLGSYYPAEHVENNSQWFEEVTDTERIEVSTIFMNKGQWNQNRSKDVFYEICFSKPVSKEKFPAIKEAIEKELNQEPTEEKKEQSRDWEVLTYRHKVLSNELDRDIIIDKKSKHFDYAHGAQNDFEINSVRRLSDGGVFSVGDFAFMTSCDFYKIKIKGFEIDNGRIRVRYEHTMWCFIDSLSKEDKRTKYLDQWHEDDTGYYRNPPNTDKQHK